MMLFTHGGAWKAGDKVLGRSYGIDFSSLGYTVASINYRLSTQAPFPAAIEDIRDSIVYLRRNSAFTGLAGLSVFKDAYTLDEMLKSE